MLLLALLSDQLSQQYLRLCLCRSPSNVAYTIFTLHRAAVRYLYFETFTHIHAHMNSATLEAPSATFTSLQCTAGAQLLCCCCYH